MADGEAARLEYRLAAIDLDGMGNAPEAVKRAARQVTASSADDGVAQAIEEIFGAFPGPVGRPEGA